jgi:hypothetical protein
MPRDGADAPVASATHTNLAQAPEMTGGVLVYGAASTVTKSRVQPTLY